MEVARRLVYRAATEIYRSAGIRRLGRVRFGNSDEGDTGAGYTIVVETVQQRRESIGR